MNILNLRYGNGTDAGRTWGSVTSNAAGDAVWKTPSHPSTTESKDPSSSKSALNKWSLSLAPSSASKCPVFFVSSVAYIHISRTSKTKNEK